MSLRNKTIAITAAILAVFGLQTWSFVSARNSLESQMAGLQAEIQAVRQSNADRATSFETDLQTVSEKIGVTTNDLEAARKANDQLKQEQARSTARLRNELAASSKAVDAFREEASTKITELSQIQNDSSTKISGDVDVVRNDLSTTKSDLSTTRNDLNATRTDLAASRREMVDIRDTLGRDIARNTAEVGELRRRGEREYFEFDLGKNKTMARIANGVQIQLKKADIKGQKYDIAMLVDDNKMEKKGQLAKEPIQFFVGKDRLRYELVVYSVDKDRIKGYVSAPKDLSGEGPKQTAAK
jgi:hypothetical protein